MASNSYHSYGRNTRQIPSPSLPPEPTIMELIQKQLKVTESVTIDSPPPQIPIIYSGKYVSARPKEWMRFGTLIQPKEDVNQKEPSLNTCETKVIKEAEDKNTNANIKTIPLDDKGKQNDATQNSSDLFVNINDPWCLITVGIQGSGKSHTVMHLVENCCMNFPGRNFLHNKMTTLICHYDPDLRNYCEAATLALHDSSNVHIIVPPDVYFDRKKFYSDLPRVKIHPLLFNFRNLSVEHMRKLMTVEAGDNILYMNVLKNTLRKHQKEGTQFSSIRELENELLKKDLQKQQIAPLKQRITLLQSLLAGEQENEKVKQDAQSNKTFLEDIRSLFKEKGAVIILDLSNPFMDQGEACGVFNILVDMFVQYPLDHGKVLCFDEAHKFLSKSNELANTIILTARELRHHGIRLLVSTQNPDVLPDELMELSSLAVLHQIFSPRWIHYLKARYPISDSVGKQLEGLGIGQAVVYSPRAAINSPSIGSECTLIKVLPRKYNSSGSKLNS